MNGLNDFPTNHLELWRQISREQREKAAKEGRGQFVFTPSGLDEFAGYRDLNVDDLHDYVEVGDEE